MYKASKHHKDDAPKDSARFENRNGGEARRKQRRRR